MNSDPNEHSRMYSDLYAEITEVRKEAADKLCNPGFAVLHDVEQIEEGIRER